MTDWLPVRFPWLSLSVKYTAEAFLTVSCSVQYAREVGAIAIGLDILTDLLSMSSIDLDIVMIF
jgi:hypothetical protein